MLVVLSVVMALLSTGAAHRFAGLELGLCGGRIEFGLACEYAAGRLAHVRAVKTQPDASAHLGDVILGKVGIGAGRAGLSAGHACLDAFDEQLAVQGAWPTVGLKQRLGLGHDSSPQLRSSGRTSCSLVRPGMQNQCMVRLRLPSASPCADQAFTDVG